MSRVKWRSTNPKEGKRAPGAGVLHWESRDPLPVTHILWTRLLRHEDVRWEAATEGNIVIACIIAHGIAEGLHGHVTEKVVLSFDAQSESAVPWQRVFPWDTPVSHRQEIVYINACRGSGSEDEPGGPCFADVDSIRGRLLSWYEGAFHTSPGLALAYEKPSPPFAGFSTVKAPAESAEPEDADPELRCSAIVESLQRPDLVQEERRKLIFEAEVLPFRGQQAAALVPLLRQFIEEYRESNVPADLVAVGSAIRNYVATATIGEAFEAAASLLKAQGRLPIPIELEVEVTKMVVRKLTANPPAERDQYPELASRLEELVDAYASPRFLPREKYGAVALNAVLGLVLTRSGRDIEVVERMRTLGVAWFQQLLARRAARLRTDLVARDSEAKLTDIAQALEQLSEPDSPTPTS